MNENEGKVLAAATNELTWILDRDLDEGDPRVRLAPTDRTRMDRTRVRCIALLKAQQSKAEDKAEAFAELIESAQSKDAQGELFDGNGKPLTAADANGKIPETERTIEEPHLEGLQFCDGDECQNPATCRIQQPDECWSYYCDTCFPETARDERPYERLEATQEASEASDPSEATSIPKGLPEDLLRTYFTVQEQPGTRDCWWERWEKVYGITPAKAKKWFKQLESDGLIQVHECGGGVWLTEKGTQLVGDHKAEPWSWSTGGPPGTEPAQPVSTYSKAAVREAIIVSVKGGHGKTDTLDNVAAEFGLHRLQVSEEWQCLEETGYGNLFIESAGPGKWQVVERAEADWKIPGADMPPSVQKGLIQAIQDGMPRKKAIKTVAKLTKLPEIQIQSHWEAAERKGWIQQDAEGRLVADFPEAVAV